MHSAIPSLNVLEIVQREAIVLALRRAGNITTAARALGVDPVTIHRNRKRFHISDFEWKQDTARGLSFEPPIAFRPSSVCTYCSP